jgi:energy-coupling factor transporter ATP-binding protein EcfA2
MKQVPYVFPEKNVFKAREALDTDFDIDRPNTNLYIDLDDVRIISEETDYKDNLYFMLNVAPESNKLETMAEDYTKVLFLGHRGCGKTTELRRIHQFLNHPDRYFSIHIEIEKELEVSKMQAEDFYIIMVIKLIRQLKEVGLHRATDSFDELLKDWLSEKEVQEEITNTRGVEGSATLKVDTDGNFLMKALSFLKFEADMKGTLARENKTTTTIRSRIKSDLITFVTRFNNALAQVRDYCIEANKGRDLLFLMDGTEKSTFEFYEEVFQKNGHILRSLNVNLLTTLRLDAFYKLEDKPNLDFFQTLFVPMIPISENSIPRLGQIISSRVDIATFFDQDALDYLVTMSGGSLRQLLRLANQALFFSRGKKVDLERAIKTAATEGEKLYHALSPDQKEILRNNAWVDNWSHKDVSIMLFAMVLLKYNGKAGINPLLKPYFP